MKIGRPRVRVLANADAKGRVYVQPPARQYAQREPEKRYLTDAQFRQFLERLDAKYGR
jgi:hypothetical protein